MSYLRRASPLHAARAGVGAAYCAALVLAALLIPDPLVLAVLALALLGAGVGAGAGARVARSLYLSAPMALAIVLVNALVSRDGLTVIVRLGDAGPFGQLDITLESIAYGAKEALVLVVIIAACALASAAVDPDELLRSLRRVSFRSALTATIATRMVPLLALDARRIGEAQRCRPNPGGRLAVMRAITANALDRSLDIAATLEVRGYGSARRPSRAHRPWSRHDLAFSISAVAIATAAIALPAPFAFYPSIHGSLGVSTWVLGGVLAFAVLAPFAQRRGIVR
jgi:energy-coupling factor transport system permease protein